LENLNGVKIIVTEDNVLNQRIVNLMLSKTGAICTNANNGEECIELLKNGEYDVVLLDLNMPVMDGYETAHYIRHELKSNIPIVAVTADKVEGEEETYLVEGIDAVLSKPIELDNFIHIFRQLLNKNTK
jgi:CheY-like chemotaxis protein